MSLPIRTTLDDLDAVCGYLTTKPTGATLAEAKAVVDKKKLDGRKLSALKMWGLIEEVDGKLKITDRGRRSVKDAGAFRSDSLREVVRELEPYATVVERAAHRKEDSIAATDLAAYWHEHFKEDVSDSDRGLNDQAVCFFQVAQGADLGTLIIGRKGMSTRFDFEPEALRAFVDGSDEVPYQSSSTGDSPKVNGLTGESAGEFRHEEAKGTISHGNRVFITHGKNNAILEQVKELVAYGKFEPVVAMEHETVAKPVPKKVMDEMRTCKAAVIHVSVDGVSRDEEDNEIPRINENVLIEIGAAMALYGDKFILLVEEGVDLPSNLQGLYECRYEGADLKLPAIMKLLKALSEF